MRDPLLEMTQFEKVFTDTVQQFSIQKEQK